MPIFYSTFWGDYWNYYRHPRYPLSTEEEKRFAQESNKVKISKERLNLLAWQNRINVIPTLILIIGMAVAVIKAVKNFSRRRGFTQQQLGEGFLALFFVIAFLVFFYTNIEFPNIYKGDTIKASYVLLAIPVLIYFATKQLISWRKHPWLFYPAMTVVAISIIFNLHFDYF